MQEDVVITRSGPVATLRINRPEHENRLTTALLKRLREALEEAETASDVKALVLTGTGATFSCGGDVAELAAASHVELREFGKRFAAVHLALHWLSKPVLAAVNGDAFAGGVSLVACCDLAIARASARFAMPEVKTGLFPILAMVTLNRLLPRKRAFELYYLGEPFGAERARDWGLVNWVVPDGEFDAAVRARGEQLAALPGCTVRIGRTTFAGIADRSYEDGFRYGTERLVELLLDPETAGALAARARGPKR